MTLRRKRQIKRTALLATLILLISILTSISSLKTARASTTIYIRAEGSIDPVTAPIQRNGNFYTLIGNINSDVDGIVIERNNVTLDGAGYTLQGTKAPSSNGIYLSGISGVTIKNMSIKAFESGILLDAYSSHNEISGNKIEDNEYGISCWGYSDNNKMTGNNITANNLAGIWIVGSSNSYVLGNNIAGNSEYGMSIESSSNNSVYHNNFIDNANQIFIYDSRNYWDNGYPFGGNYWDDYTGEDLNGDGIGETPYVIDENNIDHVVLIEPYVPDAAITNTKPSKTVVGQGYTVSIDVTIVNQGNYMENLNFTAYANATAIKSQALTLTRWTSTTITLTWNTTGFAKGNYVMSAYAWPVPGETETGDNTFIDGSVIVSTPGDVDGDGVVGGLDAGLLGYHWPPQPYYPNCDIDCDGVIGGLDAGLIGYYWGKTDPYQTSLIAAA